MTLPAHLPAVVIGGGPAGLMAAEQLANAGVPVAVFDAMPSVGRKFLRAGIGGLNITHSENSGAFLARFGDRHSDIANLLQHFDVAALRSWCEELGVDTFVGSSGRVFPKEMKAAPLLRKWLRRLRSTGVQFHTRHRWLGWDADSALCFDTPGGEVTLRADTVIFALGGASWSALGSDGLWAKHFLQRDIHCLPFRPSNCGFLCEWPASFKETQAGEPLKHIGLSLHLAGGDRWFRKGDAIITEYGIEGSLVYAASRWIRDAIDARGSADIFWDLLPDKKENELQAALGNRKDSTSNQLRKLGIRGSKLALLKALTTKTQMLDSQQLPGLLKALPQTLSGYRPIDEAISTAGGVTFAALNSTLMVKQMPGTFCAGEMLDWEAPTGGYLLTACFASGVLAGRGALTYLKTHTTEHSH